MSLSTMRKSTTTPLSRKIAEAIAEDEASKQEAVNACWATIWQALIRAELKCGLDSDEMDVRLALEDLVELGAITDPTETINEASRIVQKLVKRQVLLTVETAAHQMRKDAASDHKRFERFAEKASRQLRLRAAAFKPRNAPPPDRRFVNNPQYAALVDSNDPQYWLVMDDATETAVRQRAADHIAELADKANELALPAELSQFIDEFNIDHPDYRDARDSRNGHDGKYSELEERATAKRKHEAKQREATRLRHRIADLTSGAIYKAAKDNYFLDELSREAMILKVECPIDVEVFRDTVTRKINKTRYQVLLDAAASEAKRLSVVLESLESEIAMGPTADPSPEINGGEPVQSKAPGAVAEIVESEEADAADEDLDADYPYDEK